jgi:hypothetical protein
MQAQPISTTKKARQLRGKAVWLCLLAGAIALALVARLGVREGTAQASAQAAEKFTQSTSAQAPTAESPMKQEIHASASDERQKQIADESASLLSLANSLKAAVDKTTKDTLSVTVVREAGEIERLAHKMRTK